MAKATYWTVTDAEARKCGEQTGLDTLVVHTVAGLVEHMAQSSAARVGYIARYILHVPVTIGYIGSVRKLKVFRHPAAGERLDTSVFFRQDVFGITLTDVEVRCGDEVIATAAIKTALTDKQIEE